MQAVRRLGTDSILMGRDHVETMRFNPKRIMLHGDDGSTLALRKSEYGTRAQRARFPNGPRASALREVTTRFFGSPTSWFEV